MKTKKQVQAYLKAHNFQTATDCQLVAAFLQQSRILTLTELPTFSEPGPDKAQTFIEWFEHGFGCGDIAVESDTGRFLLISSNDLNMTEICANRSENGTWNIENGSYPCSSLSHPDPDKATNMVIELARHSDCTKKVHSIHQRPRRVRQRFPYRTGCCSLRGLGKRTDGIVLLLLV